MRIVSSLAIGTLFLSISGLLFAQETPGAGKDPSRHTTGQKLVELFTVGFGRGAASQKDAQRLFESLRGVHANDPRIDYSYSLILIKQLRNKDAIAQLQSLTSGSGKDFWPAWQALIWLHLVSKDYPSGYTRMNDFARRLTSASAPADLPEREESAEWIGRVIAALEKSVETVKQREALAKHEESLQAILGDPLRPSLERGKSGVDTLRSLMEEDVEQTREMSEAKDAKDRAEKAIQVAKDLESSAEKREMLKKSAEEQKKYLDEQLQGFNKQLERLERDYDFLQKRTLGITALQVELNAEMALLDQQLMGSTKLPPQQAQAFQQRQAAIGLQLLKSQVDLDEAVTAGLAVSQRAQLVAGQRAATVRRYEEATGQLVKQDDSLNKWQDRLKKDGDKLKAPSKSKPQAVANKIQQAKTFRTYVNLDPALERDRILDSFGVSMPETPSTPKPAAK